MEKPQHTIFLSTADRAFLKAVGIDPSPTLAEERLELAKRIAQHAPPGIHSKPKPSRARRELIKRALELELWEGE